MWRKQMEQVFAVLADFASVTIDRKLNILGIFNTITSQNVPAAHPQMYLVVGYKFECTEIGKKDIKIVLIDVDGHVLFSLEGEINIGAAESGESSTINQIFRLGNLIFPQFGDYEFHVLVNGRIESRVPFKVSLLPAQAS
jgi:hypothetical protein